MDAEGTGEIVGGKEDGHGRLVGYPHHAPGRLVPTCSDRAVSTPRPSLVTLDASPRRPVAETNTESALAGTDAVRRLDLWWCS